MVFTGGPERRCPSESSWSFVDYDGFSEEREPQYKDCNMSSVQTASASSASSTSSSPDDIVLESARLCISDKEEDYNPFVHYPNSLESGNTDSTVRVGDNGEALQPHDVENPKPAVPVVVLENLEPYLRQLPQHTFKDIHEWIAGAGAGALYIPFAPVHSSIMVETSSAGGTNSGSHSRAGILHNSPDIDILGMGMWSEINPGVYGSRKLRVTERK